MFGINRRDLDRKTKIPNSKTIPGKSNDSVFAPFKQIIWNVIDNVGEFSLYEMAHWVNNMDRWLHNRTCQENLKSYKRGSILLVDLGANNFRFEPSFTHPCIVLQNRRNTMYIVPCSTKKYGLGYPEIIDATPADGFQSNTGIQIESARWIHKNRIVSAHGKISSRVLNEIDQYLLNNIPTYKKEKIKFLKSEEENILLKKRIAELEAELDDITKKSEAATE